MHQRLCGVNESLFVGGYEVTILEVTEDSVQIGLSTPGSGRVVHDIRLAGAETTTQFAFPLESTRPALS